MSDNELEYVKRKKLLEMQRRLLMDKATEKVQPTDEPKAKDPEIVLKQIFTEDTWKVWRTAEQQFPQVIGEVAKALAALHEAGKLKDKVTGEQIYWLFQQLGLHIHLETKIRILESGEMKTIADKLRGK